MNRRNKKKPTRNPNPENRILEQITEKSNELCHKLLQIASGKPVSQSEANSDYSALKEITNDLLTLQKDACLVGKLLSTKSFDRHNLLTRLLEQFKECCCQPVCISDNGNCGFGLKAVNAIEKNSCLFHIPFSFAFTTHRLTTPLPKFLTKDPLFAGMENVALSLALLHELALKEKSTWQNYIYSLPPSYLTFLYYSEENYSMFGGFPHTDKLIHEFRNVCRQYAYFFLLFEKYKHLNASPEISHIFCFEDYRWAVSTIMSRNNKLPMVDKFGNPTGESYLCLLPIWDMLNHKFDQVTTDFDLSNKSVLYYAMESFEPGEEIFMDYGHRTSTEFLLYSGFVPSHNPHHRVSIKLGVCKSDKLYESRISLLSVIGLQRELCISLSANDEVFPPIDFVCFAQIFTMTAEELQMSSLFIDNCNQSEEDKRNQFVSSVAANSQKALKFIQNRLNLLIASFSSKLAKALQMKQQTNPSTDYLYNQCKCLCEQDISVLQQCLSRMSPIQG